MSMKRNLMQITIMASEMGHVSLVFECTRVAIFDWTEMYSRFCPRFGTAAVTTRLEARGSCTVFVFCLSCIPPDLGIPSIQYPQPHLTWLGDVELLVGDARLLVGTAIVNLGESWLLASSIIKRANAPRDEIGRDSV